VEQIMKLESEQAELHLKFKEKEERYVYKIELLQLRLNQIEIKNEEMQQFNSRMDQLNREIECLNWTQREQEKNFLQLESNLSFAERLIMIAQQNPICTLLLSPKRKVKDQTKAKFRTPKLSSEEKKRFIEYTRN